MPIRQSDLKEREAIADLWRRAWASANPQVNSLEPIDHWLGRVDAEFAPPSEVFVVEQDGQPEGFIVIEPNRYYVAQVFVDVGRQSRGLGLALLQVACQRMPSGWHLHVATGNSGARRFYARCGLIAGEVSTNPVSLRERIEYRWKAKDHCQAGNADRHVLPISTAAASHLQ